MVDYVRSTGASGEMMIRDTGSIVEYWIRTTSGSTWTDHLPWGWTINGSNGSSTYNYPPGAGWRRLGNYLVTYNQRVYFRIGATGTSGFGGPTEHWADINRQSTPPAPSQPTVEEVTSTSARVRFNSNGDGGLTIEEWQIGVGTNFNDISWTVSSSGNTVVTSLTPGTTYYFWARGRNSLGWGAWSPRSSGITTQGYAATLEAPAVSAVTQTTAVVTFSSEATDIIEYQVGWHTSPTLNPDVRTIATSPATITNLPPATTLYFRVRARNPAGWNSWSAATAAKTSAGAKVRVAGVWKEAVPYVKQGGVWKVAAPFVKDLGVWKPVT